MFKGQKIKLSKKNVKIYLFFSLLVALFIIFTRININSTEQFDSVNKDNIDDPFIIQLKNSGMYDLNFIHVDNNWSDTADNENWCFFDGNSYIIENVTIDASGSNYGILISQLN